MKNHKIKIGKIYQYEIHTEEIIVSQLKTQKFR